MIDVIIPTYKAHDTLFRALSSIAAQINADKIEVTVVNDCCPEGNYKDIIKRFRPTLKIKEIQTPKNGGPGLARQYGIDHTHNPFIVFVDSDDMLGDSLSLTVMLQAMNLEEEYPCVMGMFIEELDEGKTLQHQPTLGWVHGKMFRRAFLEKYGIKFNSTRSCEDFGFNSKVFAMAGEDKMFNIQSFTYIWSNGPNTIARINNSQYRYDQCFRGMLENNIDTLKFMEQHEVDYKKRETHILTTLIEAFFLYNEVLVNGPEFNEQSWYYCRKYYHYCKEYIDKITNDRLLEMVNTYLIQEAQAGHPVMCLHTITLLDFIKHLKETPFFEDEIYQIVQKIPKELIDNIKKVGNYDENVYKWE